MRLGLPLVSVALLGCWFAAFDLAGIGGSGSFQFEILGDRTGNAQPGVFEEAWREAIDTQPAFVLSVGDSIEGFDDQTAERQWNEFQGIVGDKPRYPLFLTPGNHDIWSARSKALFVQRAHHPSHYSFDYHQAHFVVLDNSRDADGPSAQFSSEEMDFLEEDLAAHASQPVKFVVSHRPAWLFPVLLGNPKTPFHQLLKRYGVRYVLAGHIHQLLHFELDGITFLDLGSSGGHLRDTKQYERGWFFAHTSVSVEGSEAKFLIRELQAPYGKGRVTTPADWGSAGLVH